MPSRCSANWTEISSGSDSVLVRLSSNGGGSLPCNFSLQVTDGSQAQSADCALDGDSLSRFICRLAGLQPGTLYRLAVISNKDGERSNMSVRTGEST